MFCLRNKKNNFHLHTIYLEVGVQRYAKKPTAIYCNMENPYCDTYCDTPGIFVSVYYCPNISIIYFKGHEIGIYLHTVNFSATPSVPQLLFMEK